MQINFDRILQTIDGRDLSIEGGQEATLKHFTCDALLLSFNDERELSAETKCSRWLLATRIFANPQNIDLKAEEIADIKKLIGKAYGPMVVGQAFEMLEGH